MRFTRRGLLFTLPLLASLLLAAQKKKYFINSVNGSIDADALETTLIHEHFLVDFIGASKTSLDR